MSWPSATLIEIAAAPPSPARSNINVVRATCQPLPTPPITFPSGMPDVSTTGRPITRPSTFAGEGAPARAISSLNIACSISVAPRPPYSFGHDRPVQPPPCNFFCHWHWNSKASSSRRGAGPGLFPSSQPRSSSLNACSEGERERSKARAMLTAPRLLLRLLQLLLDDAALVVDLQPLLEDRDRLIRMPGHAQRMTQVEERVRVGQPRARPLRDDLPVELDRFVVFALVDQ